MKASCLRNILIMALIISGLVISSSYAKTIQLDESLKKIPICPFSEYLEDIGGKLTLQDIRSKSNQNRWISTDKKTLGFGFTKSVYWIRFTIENKTDNEFEFFIEQAYPLIDSIILYVPDTKGIGAIEVGDRKPFAERLYEHKNFIFPMKLGARSATTYFMRYKTESSMNLLLSVWSPESFRSSSSIEYWILMIFYGIFLIMLIYNLIIFFFIRRVEYLFYVIFTFCFLLLVMSLNGTAYQFLWPDSPGWGNFCTPFLLALTVLTAGLFCIELAELRTVRKGIPYRETIFKIAIFIYTIAIITIIAVIFIDYRNAMVLTTALAGFCMTNIAVIGVILIIRERNRSIIFALTAGGFLLIGGTAYVLKTFGIFPSNFFTEWSLHIGSIIMVTIFSIVLADRINTMKENIEKAENKYRNLIETSGDIIFSLDGNSNFTSMNTKVKKHLGYKVDDVIGKSILDFIHERWSEKQQIARMVVEEYISELKRTEKSVSFRTDFKTRYTHEPREMTVVLELIPTKNEKVNILGKASLVLDDIILQYLESEKHTYAFANYLSNAELISQRLTRNLNKHLNPSEISNIRVSLREMLINSIEHGNLDINFEDKTQATLDGTYLDFVQQRQKDPNYREKKVQIQYLLSINSVEYIISDEGKGFDYKEYLHPTYDEPNIEMLLARGRGIAMAVDAFDKVDYNEKGNEVSLVKYFQKQEK